MSFFRQLESLITAEARLVFCNKKLRVKDVQEWSSGQITPQEGEITERLPMNGVWVTIKVESDKRQKPGA